MLDEVIPNLNLLKGLENGKQFKENITKSIDYIENKQKIIKQKIIKEKLNKLKKEKVILFEELKNINENFKNKTDIGELNKLRGQRLAILDKTLELSKQQYVINQSCEKDIMEEFTKESQQFINSNILKGKSRISFILDKNSQNLPDPISDKKYAVTQFKSFVQREKERRNQKVHTNGVTISSNSITPS